MKLSQTLNKQWVWLILFATIFSTIIIYFSFSLFFLLVIAAILIVWFMISLDIKEYSEPLDEFILNAINKNKPITKFYTYSIVLDGVELSIINYPYSYGWIKPGSSSDGMPSKATKKKLREYIIKCKLEQKT